MKIYFGQFYIQPGVEYPFSTQFQIYLSDKVSALVDDSEAFTRRWRNNYKMIFNLSAKMAIEECEIRGPTVFKKVKNVEYSLFLPYDRIQKSRNPIKSAADQWLISTEKVLTSLGFDTAKLREQHHVILDEICTNRAMFEDE